MGLPIQFGGPWRSNSPQARLGLERDVLDEIEFHLAMRADENERSGMAAMAARNRAEVQFGDVQKIARGDTTGRLTKIA